MSPEVAGFVGIGVLILLFLLGMPVAFAMATVGLAGFCYLGGLESGLSILAQDVFETLGSYPLSVIPMFILMGSFAYASGISKRLYRTNYSWVGQYRGGLTIATILTCAGFAAICGSTAATAATMGQVALPEMKKYGYSDQLATGTVAAGGTLGILIPPSTILIIYGILTEQSIGKLFIAGIMPGVLLSLAYVLTIVFLCGRNPELGPPGPATTFRKKIHALTGIIEAILLFGLTIGGIFVGWFSPTQAGAIGATGALAIGFFRRQISVRIMYQASKDGLMTACMVLYIITGATVFGHFMAISNIPFALADGVGSLSLSPMLVMIIIILIYFLGGFFMDSMALVVVTLPIFFPIVSNLGFDPIWFGVIIVLVAEMGVITPPVGVNVFVIKGLVPEVSMGTIYKGIMPFLVALILVTILMIIFPQIATLLPSLVHY